MWEIFLLTCVTGAFCLYVPGYLVFRALRFGRLAAFALAPVASAGAYAAAALLLSGVGVSCSGWALLAVALAVGAAAFVASAAVGEEHGSLAGRAEVPVPVKATAALLDTKPSFAILLGYVAFALVVCAVVLVKPLDGADSFANFYDNYLHLGAVRTMLSTGVYSPISPSIYPLSDGQAVTPYLDSSASLYPALWHELVAMLASIVGCPVALGANAVNALLCAVVFPSGVWLLLSLLFVDGRVVTCGALACVSFAAFPWGFIMYGALFPNLLGFSLAPMSFALLVLATSSDQDKKTRIVLSLVLAAALLVDCLGHPNAVFTLAVIAVPFATSRALHAKTLGVVVRQRRLDALPAALLRIGAAAAVALAALAIWTACYHAEPLQSVVQYSFWEPFASVSQAVVNLLLVQLDLLSAPQLVMSVLVLAGIVRTLVFRSNRWLIASLFLAGTVYVACASASDESFWRHFMAGFWYADAYRVAALCALAAVPLAAAGGALVLELVLAACGHVHARVAANVGEAEGTPGAGGSQAAQKSPDTHDLPAPQTARVPYSRRAARAGAAIVAAVLVVANFCPSYTLYEGEDEGSRGTVSVPDSVVQTRVATAFGIVEDRIAWSCNSVLTKEERDFAQQARDIVGQDLVINDPYDGSVWLYGSEGLNTYYRDLSGFRNETNESALIRRSLNDYRVDEETFRAVEEIGARYVLLLDASSADGEQTRNTTWETYYSPLENWRGLYSITEGRSMGFELVLSDGDMRLYRIQDGRR